MLLSLPPDHCSLLRDSLLFCKTLPAQGLMGKEQDVLCLGSHSLCDGGSALDTRHLFYSPEVSTKICS